MRIAFLPPAKNGFYGVEFAHSAFTNVSSRKHNSKWADSDEGSRRIGEAGGAIPPQ
jgi:hypothetical protein